VRRRCRTPNGRSPDGVRAEKGAATVPGEFVHRVNIRPYVAEMATLPATKRAATLTFVKEIRTRVADLNTWD
jgi:hypothetical protein